MIMLMMMMITKYDDDNDGGDDVVDVMNERRMDGRRAAGESLAAQTKNPI